MTHGESKQRMVSVGAAALNLIPLDFDHNVSVVLEAVQEAKAQGVGLLCLPELSLCGYGCEDAFLYRSTAQRSLEALCAIIPQSDTLALCVGLPVWYEDRCYNAIAFIAHRKLLGFVCKQHLAGYGIHYEPRWFSPWKAGAVGSISYLDERYPCGDLVFDLGDIRVGFEICEDAWVDTRPGQSLAHRGVDIILNPSASHFALDKVKVRRKIVSEGSRDFQALYVYANVLGNESGRVIYDGDTIIARSGEIVASGPRFALSNFTLTALATQITPKQRLKEVAGDSIAGPSLIHVEDSKIKTPPSLQWEKSEAFAYEEFMRATTLGLFDYMRKSRCRGFVLSLSGGADSACVALLIHCLAHRIQHEMPLSDLIQKLAYWDSITNLTNKHASDLTRLFLHSVYQSTENSSAITHHAASQLAHSINAEFHGVSLRSVYEDYMRLFAPVCGRELSWSSDDIALQNIQSRIRSPGIWLVANVKQALLLTTSNRSEASVGYATMDGDMSGGLAPIAGISKYFVQQFLRHMETIGLSRIDPLPILSLITCQAPTAELRPLSSEQTDEKDLMPYRVLDCIERKLIGERCTIADTIIAVQQVFCDQYTPEQINTWAHTFARLWRSNQWKRERTAPSFHLDDYNVDPRSWCRFPILSGGLL